MNVSSKDKETIYTSFFWSHLLAAIKFKYGKNCNILNLSSVFETWYISSISFPHKIQKYHLARLYIDLQYVFIQEMFVFWEDEP